VELDMSMTLFRQILVLSGTDYNINDSTNLNETMSWYHEYKKQMARGKEPRDFYDWLCMHTKYITNLELLQKVYNMFIIDANANLNRVEFDNHVCIREKDENALTLILEKDGFLK
jgi:hypothetical protein